MPDGSPLQVDTGAAARVMRLASLEDTEARSPTFGMQVDSGNATVTLQLPDGAGGKKVKKHRKKKVRDGDGAKLKITNKQLATGHLAAPAADALDSPTAGDRRK